MDKVKTAELIWKYLDGSYSDEEEVVFHHLISTDLSFKNEFEEATNIHDGLQNLPLIKAPDGLISETIQSLKFKSRYQFQSTPLVIFLVGISFLLILTILLPPVESGLPYLAPWLSKMYLPISIDLSAMSHLGSYMLIFLAIPLFALIDYFISDKMKVHGLA